MGYEINVQPTPNPNALKFILNVLLAQGGSATYKDKTDCQGNAMAEKLFEIDSVQEIYFHDNFVTVTQNGKADWDGLEAKIQAVILETVEQHDPKIVAKPAPATATTSADTPELAQINVILDETIRPYLQRDGGDLQVISYEENILTIIYKGACGGCPSARFGTLRAIENVLREKYRPDISVQMAE